MGRHKLTRLSPGARAGLAASHRRPRARLGVVVAIGAAVVATGLLVVVVRSAAASTSTRVVKVPKGISGAIVALAAKWAKARGLPLQWVLATIKVESGGDPNLTGDQGRSIGLMQINTADDANGPLIKSLGLTPKSLFDPNTNIMVGTLLMRKAYDRVVAALNGRRPPADLGLLSRLAYWGPVTANVLARGGNPAVGDPRATSLIVAPWNRAIAEISALV